MMTDQTPVTDLERRARDWAERRHPTEGSPDWFAAKYILDNTPAPPKSLADEIREEGAGRPPGAVKRVNYLADRVEAVERECVELRVERDQANYLMKSACRERDEARAEVERLTAERDTKAPDDKDWLAGMKEAARYAINATRPDPADVPEGEMWLIDTDYDKGLAGVRDERGTWSVLSANGFARESELDDDEATLVARLVPDTRRVIDKAEDLDALPVGSIVIDKDGEAWQRWDGGMWSGVVSTELLSGNYDPLTVIYVPEVTA